MGQRAWVTGVHSMPFAPCPLLFVFFSVSFVRMIVYVSPSDKRLISRISTRISPNLLQNTLVPPPFFYPKSNL